MSRLVHWAVHSFSHDGRFSKLQGVYICSEVLFWVPPQPKGLCHPQDQACYPAPLTPGLQFRLCRSVHPWRHALRSKVMHVESHSLYNSLLGCRSLASPLSFSEPLIPQVVAMPRRLRHQVVLRRVTQAMRPKVRHLSGWLLFMIQAFSSRALAQTRDTH